VSEHDVSPARGELQEGAILGDDGVEAGEVPRHVVKIGQSASGDQNDHDSATARAGDGFANRRIEGAVDRDRSVVVERKS
jgi:hypothetical protein